MTLNYASLLHVLSLPFSSAQLLASRPASRQWPHYTSPPRWRQPAGAAHARVHVQLQISWKLRPRTACLELDRRDILSIHYSLKNSGVMYVYKLYLRYSTSCGERESRPFREEPETFISILISTTPMHLPARPQPLVRSVSEWAVFNVPSNTVLVIRETVFTGQKTQPTVSKYWRRIYKGKQHWSGVFNLLKFDCIAPPLQLHSNHWLLYTSITSSISNIKKIKYIQWTFHTV